MKFKYIKSIVSAALFLSLTTGITSCINDLDISPIDPQMTATFAQDMDLARKCRYPRTNLYALELLSSADRNII